MKSTALFILIMVCMAAPTVLASDVTDTLFGGNNTPVPASDITNTLYGGNNTPVPESDVTNALSGGNDTPVPALDASGHNVTNPVVSEILAAHNAYRSRLHVTPLRWSWDLAEGAQSWADFLAASHSLNHSSSVYGENIWRGPAGNFSYGEIVNYWGAENQYFLYAPFGNASSTTGTWKDTGHYTQIVWETTKECGCGLATGDGRDYLVCRYNPPGNYFGQYPYLLYKQ